MEILRIGDKDLSIDESAARSLYEHGILNRHSSLDLYVMNGEHPDYADLVKAALNDGVWMLEGIGRTMGRMNVNQGRKESSLRDAAAEAVKAWHTGNVQVTGRNSLVMSNLERALKDG